jgi:hypothetical protein
VANKEVLSGVHFDTLTIRVRDTRTICALMAFSGTHKRCAVSRLQVYAGFFKTLLFLC